MTLHEAIEKLLIEVGSSMTTDEIANKLNENRWYTKKDQSLITAYQILGRVKNYPHMFVRDGKIVSLRDK